MTRTPAHEEPYEGVLGRTRTEIVHVWMPDGAVRALPVYVGIDVASDPALASLARSGTMHHVAEGAELAIPFVYHDPNIPLFALVVPETLRHRVLAVRAEHMALIAADTSHPVPHYVREAEVVIGVRGLNVRLESGPSIPPSRDAATTLNEQALALAERERELTRRERLIDARERAVLENGGSIRSVDDDDVEEVEAGDLYPYERAMVEAEVGDDGLEDDEMEEDAEDDELEEVEDEDLEGDAFPRHASGKGYASGSFDDGDHSVVRALVIADSRPLRAGVDTAHAPSWFAEDIDAPLCLAYHDGRAWLFVREHLSHGDGGDLDLLVQVDPAAPIPVAMLTFVSDTGGVPPSVLRTILDPDDQGATRALSTLSEHFEVEIVSFANDGSMDHWATLHAPREANVRDLLAHLATHPIGDRDAFEQACRGLIDAPPPWRDVTHPFQDRTPREPPLTATEAAVLLDDLAEWLKPSRRERLSLLLCVPHELIDVRSRETIAYALDWGLSLPSPLAARAIELGIEKDEPGLLLRRIEGLCRTSREADYGGLEGSVLRALWSEALEQAARLGVSLSDEARSLAEQHAGARALVHAAALAEPHDAALAALRERALGDPPDGDALIEFAHKGAYKDLLAVCRAAARLDPDCGALVFAAVARRTDPVALDALLALLSMAEEPRVRVGAALSLASRHSVSALDELAQHVAREGEDTWPLFALALGRYGAGSFRAIARALSEAQASDERVELVFAHLALYGARAQVRARSRSRDPAEARVAARALKRASELKDEKKPVLTLERQGPLTVFCELFDRYFRHAST